jgi:hypothetical protein
VQPVTAGTGFVTTVDLPAFLELLLHPVQKIHVAHFPGGLDPASILLLHRHRDLPIMYIEPQIQNPIDIVDQTGPAEGDFSLKRAPKVAEHGSVLAEDIFGESLTAS